LMALQVSESACTATFAFLTFIYTCRHIIYTTKILLCVLFLSTGLLKTCLPLLSFYYLLQLMSANCDMSCALFYAHVLTYRCTTWTHMLGAYTFCVHLAFLINLSGKCPPIKSRSSHSLTVGTNPNLSEHSSTKGIHFVLCIYFWLLQRMLNILCVYR
jgi:hypothetical protein